MARSALFVGTLVCALATGSFAAAPRAPGRVAADELTALPAAGLPAGATLRAIRDVRYGTSAAPAAWRAFTAAAGGTWEVSWDRATGAPNRIWGSGILTPGAMTSADLAALYARAWLADHVALLAPGATARDFVLVSNVNDGTIRAVGFVQTSGGTRVLGGQIGFEFKHDRLFVIGSTALPGVTADTAAPRLASTMLRTRAIAAVRDQLALPATARASELGADVVVPLIGDDAILGYRVATPIELDAGSTGRYLAYVDPATGAPIAVRQQNMYDTGTLVYRSVDRYPGRGRVDQPAPLAHVLVDGVTATTGSDGSVAVPPAGGTVTTAVTGELVTVFNIASNGVAAVASLPIPAGGTARWDASAVVEDDAQLVTYLAINTVKEFVRVNVDPNMPTLTDLLTANVNLDQDCNAFFDGYSVNFFHASATCENTGRIDDVMWHEFGHDLHAHEIIDGVGLFDGAMSEGAADTLAVNMTGDSGLGRGFHYTDEPLRELNPPDSEAVFPRDVGEIHTTGLIFGGTWWDLRQAFRDQLGDVDGEALTLRLYVGALRRSIDIPSSLVETLATDDDDGDLSNGTPHECTIRNIYGAHGMHTTSGTIAGPSLLETGAFPISSVQVRTDITGLVDRCAADTVDHVTIGWGNGAHGVPVAGSVTATRAAPGVYFAQLPLPTDGEGSYSALVTFANGTTFGLPDNRADAHYDVYQANTVKLYCTDFESDPFAAGWTTASRSGRSPWAWVVPGGGVTDPPAAFSGTHALVQAPGGNYAKSSLTSVTMPLVDVGPYSDVRLQYRRWLAVQDSHFDQARITANGNQVWQNASINMGDSSSLQHIDKEWRFQDVPLSGLFHGPQVQVGWELTADASFQLGGWALDDVCIVANPDSLCGDGVRAFSEQCDDGASNADKPDACRTDCNLPTCGDQIVDTGEECDHGAAGDATCSKKCQTIYTDSGGCTTSGGGSGGLLVVGVLWLVRRRSARAPG